MATTGIHQGHVKIWVKLLLIVLAALIVARLALPWAIENYVNRQLQRMEEYSGSVQDIDVALIRGSYRIEQLLIEKRKGKIPQPLIAAESVIFGFDWSALLYGELVGDIRLENPILNFVDGPTDAQDQTGAGPDWAERLDALIPLHINSFDIVNGTITLYRTGDDGETKRLLHLHSATLHARNFTNIRESEEPVFATLTLDGRVQERGSLHLFTEIDPLSDPPVMALDAELVELPLPSLNSLLDAYANVDAEAGVVEIFIEFASKEGRFDGYVKPLVQDAEILRVDEEGSFFGKVWQGIVDAVAKILENPDTDRIGAQVPLSGELTAVDVELIPAVFSILENAFIEALSVGIGNVIGLEDIGLGPDKQAPDDDNDG
jgi:hypothetical protein